MCRIVFVHIASCTLPSSGCALRYFGYLGICAPGFFIPVWNLQVELKREVKWFLFQRSPYLRWEVCTWRGILGAIETVLIWPLRMRAAPRTVVRACCSRPWIPYLNYCVQISGDPAILWPSLVLFQLRRLFLLSLSLYFPCVTPKFSKNFLCRLNLH